MRDRDTGRIQMRVKIIGRKSGIKQYKIAKVPLYLQSTFWIDLVKVQSFSEQIFALLHYRYEHPNMNFQKYFYYLHSNTWSFLLGFFTPIQNSQSTTSTSRIFNIQYLWHFPIFIFLLFLTELVIYGVLAYLEHVEKSQGTRGEVSWSW